MVKARAKQSVPEQAKKRIEDLGIFFELLWDKIRAPKGAIITAVLACLVVGCGVFAARAHINNRTSEQVEIKTSTNSEKHANSSTKNNSNNATSGKKKTDESVSDKKETSNSTNGRSNRRTGSDASDGWAAADDPLVMTSLSPEGDSRGNSSVAGDVSAENNVTNEPAQEPIGDFGEGSGVSGVPINDDSAMDDSGSEAPIDNTELIEE